MSGHRVFNFGAGPAVLPVPVLEEMSRGVREFKDSGMSVLELSHRSAAYEKIHQDTQSRLLKLMGLERNDFTVIFLGGGASLQFAMVPMNFLKPGESADYIHTGEWSLKAIKEAERFGKVHIAGSSEAQGFRAIPKYLKFSTGAKYVHLTTNNTIEGTEYSDIPDTGGIPLIGDASSDILSRRFDYSRFDLIYAGAQKNLGPAGVTIVVVRNTFLQQAQDPGPTLLRYKTHAAADSLYNTPPTFAIYAVGLVLEWIDHEGGLEKIEERNRRKAEIIYQALDKYSGTFDPTVHAVEDRSWMNITFKLKDANREAEFLAGAQARGMEGLKGHRLVGGFRASLYNAFPVEGAHALAEYLSAFAMHRI